jgi:hypothetical protein
MTAFKRLASMFDVTWATILAGWNGAGTFSPWPRCRDEFPSFLGIEDVRAFAELRLQSTSNPAEEKLIVGLLSIDGHSATREEVRHSLDLLAGEVNALEYRKWRLVLLLELLDRIPQCAVYGLLGLTEFWQEWGFPGDGPHAAQGVRNSISVSEYYTDANFQRSLARHREWAAEEEARIRTEAVRGTATD